MFHQHLLGRVGCAALCMYCIVCYNTVDQIIQRKWNLISCTWLPRLVRHFLEKVWQGAAKRYTEWIRDEALLITRVLCAVIRSPMFDWGAPLLAPFFPDKPTVFGLVFSCVQIKIYRVILITKTIHSYTIIHLWFRINAEVNITTKYSLWNFTF